MITGTKRSIENMFNNNPVKESQAKRQKHGQGQNMDVSQKVGQQMPAFFEAAAAYAVAGDQRATDLVKFMASQAMDTEKSIEQQVDDLSRLLQNWTS